MDPRIDVLLDQLARGELSVVEYRRRLNALLDEADHEARRQSDEHVRLEQIAVAARKAAAL